MFRSLFNFLRASRSFQLSFSLDFDWIESRLYSCYGWEASFSSSSIFNNKRRHVSTLTLEHHPEKEESRIRWIFKEKPRRMMMEGKNSLTPRRETGIILCSTITGFRCKWGYYAVAVIRPALRVKRVNWPFRSTDWCDVTDPMSRLFLQVEFSVSLARDIVATTVSMSRANLVIWRGASNPQPALINYISTFRLAEILMRSSRWESFFTRETQTVKQLILIAN